MTDVFVIVGDSDGGSTARYMQAHEVAQQVADAISLFVFEEEGGVPVISLKRDNWQELQAGKVAGSAVIWFGWNYAQPEKLEEHLKAQGFKNITVWSHHEFEGMDGVPPRVVSW